MGSFYNDSNNHPKDMDSKEINTTLREYKIETGLDYNYPTPDGDYAGWLEDRLRNSIDKNKELEKKLDIAIEGFQIITELEFTLTAQEYAEEILNQLEGDQNDM